MEEKTYEAPSADKVEIEDTNILSGSQIKTNHEGSASDNLWDLM